MMTLKMQLLMILFFPAWMSGSQLSEYTTRFNLVVAKDRSGNFTTINEAMAAASINSKTRYFG